MFCCSKKAMYGDFQEGASGQERMVILHSSNHHRNRLAFLDVDQDAFCLKCKVVFSMVDQNPGVREFYGVIQILLTAMDVPRMDS